MITLQASRLTEEQLEIITSTEPCLTVTAYAGTGKTTTIRALAQARPHERMLYLAFNRSLATETRAAFGDLKNVEVKTLHGLAWHECGRNYRKIADIRPFELSSFINSRLSDSFEDSFGLARIVLDGLNDWLNSAYREIELFLKNYARRLGLRTKELNAGSRDGKIDVKTVQNLIKETWSACQNRRLAMPHNGYLKLFQLSQKNVSCPLTAS
ncbi:MAG: AAA family ATPase [Deltaproteobacteria bacterium]|jgi:superfamily I DNA/RNA helicase|nr:AAA family ATPase [Deltaproteobacteria bacterium]